MYVRSDIAAVLRQANRPEKAMIAHEKALEWQELFELAVQRELSDDELKEVAYRVAGKCLTTLDIVLIGSSEINRGSRVEKEDVRGSTSPP